MYTEKASKLFAKYALPQMVGLLFNSVYLIVDGVFIGNRLGRQAMAAAAVAVPAIEILIAISIAISIGAGIMVSGMLGRQNNKGARNLFNVTVAITLIVSTAIVIFGNVFLQQIAVFLGSTPDILNDAVTYLWYILSFSPLLMFSFLLSGFARNDNKPKLAMAALAIGSSSNIVLDYLFMYPLNMGIAGAALATALGPVISVMILLPHFIKKQGTLYFSKFTVNIKKAGMIFVLGFPAFIMEFSIGIVTFIYNYAIVHNGLDEMGLASYLIIGYIALIVLTVFLGISQGLQPLFSYFKGRGDTISMRLLLAFSAKSVFIIGAAAYMLILLFSKYFISVFVPGDIDLIGFTYQASKTYFFGFAFAGLNILFITYWQSIEKTLPALITSLLRSVIILPLLTAVLPAAFGVHAVWAAVSLAEAATLIFVACFAVKRKG